MTAPDLIIPSRDGTPIAVFRSGAADAPPLILVHGASADHTTFRVVGPMLAARFHVHAMDRRGRGASGDTLPYTIEREAEDIVAVASSLARKGGVDGVDVLGHSFGGRCALGAALMDPVIRRVISYEGAPASAGRPYWEGDLADRLAQLADAGRLDELLPLFLERVVGMTPADLARYRADPVWPHRVRAAGTIARELSAEAADTASLERMRAITQPVLQVLGGDSTATFASATHALDSVLRHGRVVVIPGARHAAHHTHPDAVVRAATAFLLEGPDGIVT
ncbi:MAG: alpha/beta hydrolase [Chloroflexota bacterium]